MQRARASSPSTVTLTAVLALLGAMGCGGGKDDLKKQVRSLETQVTTLRADADRLEERLQALELGGAGAARQESRAEGDEQRQERPRLKTIRLAPEDEPPPSPAVEVPATPEPESEGGRPVIRGTGDRVIKTGDASPSGRFSPRHDAYAGALAMARQGRLEDAIGQLERYAATHPTSHYADNALFWAARCHAALGHDEAALALYEDVLRLHPRGNKVAEARVEAARLVAFLEQRGARGAVPGALAQRSAAGSGARRARRGD
jgi:TolA-binding protein